MTTYVDPQHVTVIVERAKTEPCTCALVGILTDMRHEECLKHLILGLLQPTVTAHEVPW